MIRSYEEHDFTQITRIWIDAHIKERGFIPTDLWRNGIDTLKMSIGASEVYVICDKRNIHGFIELDNDEITGLFVTRDHHFRKALTQLLDYAKSGHDKLTLHALNKDIDSIRIYESCGFSDNGVCVNQFTNEPELLYVWRRS